MAQQTAAPRAPARTRTARIGGLLAGLVLGFALVCGLAVVGGELLALNSAALRVQGVQVEGLSLAGLNASLVVSASNESPLPVRVVEQHMEIFVNDQLLTIIDDGAPVKLPAGTTRTISHPVTVASLPSLGLIVQSSVGGAPINVRVQGYVVLRSQYLGLEGQRDLLWSDTVRP